MNAPIASEWLAARGASPMEELRTRTELVERARRANAEWLRAKDGARRNGR